jgi:hypothetical protein
VSIEQKPGLRKRLGARLGPEQLAAVMTVLGLILIGIVLAVLVVGTR